MEGHEGLDDGCPNCGCAGECSRHLNLCLDDGRTTLFYDMVDRLEDWLLTSSTDPDLAYWLPRYLRSRNTCSFSQLGILPLHLANLARSQDAIGWLHFLEGKVSNEIRNIQALYLAQTNTRMSVDTWMSKFVSQLLDISHSQWIYRNIAVHHHTRGSIQLAHRKEILAEIERQLHLPMSEIPESYRFLLEVSPHELERDHPTQQSYWLLAIQAARKAGRRVVTRIRRRRSPHAIAAAASRAAKRTKHSETSYVDSPFDGSSVVGKHPLLGGDVEDPLYKRRKPD